MFKKTLAYGRRRRRDGPKDLQIPDEPHPLTRDLSLGSTSKLSSLSLSIIGRRFVSSKATIKQEHGGEEANSEPLGLKVVHRPSTTRCVDIIFVHGLGGASRRTWSKYGDPSLFWPGTFLPFEPDIKEARILTFGYNSNFRPGSGKSTMSILDFAKELLYDMKYAIDENSIPNSDNLQMGERPIIFIVHSMGGLIVKEVYIQGQNDPAYTEITKAISSIIFLSTPHRGTNLAETLNRILRVSIIGNPMQFIAELSTGSQTLQQLNEQFRHIAPRLQIVSFYETRPTSMARTQVMVLEKDSSVLGYPGEVSKPLDADHHDVCKFNGPDDPRYIAVRNVLKALVRKAEQSNVKDGTQEAQPITRQLDIEEYLSIHETPDIDYNFFRDRWIPGTCKWILGHKEFTGWVQDQHCKPHVLWIHGNAASGKSILSSFIIDHLVQRGLMCHYFFIRFLNQKKRTTSMVLRSLACQLANSMPAYAKSLGHLEVAVTDLKNADYRRIWQWLFKQALFQLEIGSPIFLVIDGVDEADGPSSIIRLLSELSLTKIPFRILIVSRKTHEISSAFLKVGEQVHVDTIHAEGNVDDFRSYIRHEMNLAGDESYLNEISSKLVNQAKGNFLWLHLAVQEVNSCYTRQDVEDAVKQLPSGMEALYDRMSFSIQSRAKESDRQLGGDILGLVACAQRPMGVEELSDALANTGILEIHRTIADLCGGFVTVDNEGRVAMVHETAREYLTRRGGERPPVIDQESTNCQLLRRCIARLADPMLRGQINRSKQSAFLGYASETWFIHFSQSSTSNPDVLQTVTEFLCSPHVLTWMYFMAKRKELQVLVGASRHITDVVLRLRAAGIGETLPQHRTVDVLENWAIDLIKIVGKFGNTLKQHPDSIYKLVPPFCPENSIIYDQFGRKESRALNVLSAASGTWDDCLARFTFGLGASASCVIAAGNRIAFLANVQATGYLIIYSAATFEEQWRLIHPEWTSKIQFNDTGGLLVTYGYMTTRVWDMKTGECIKVVKNPSRQPEPQTLLFSSDSTAVLAGSQDRRVRSFLLDSTGDEWNINVQINEQPVENTYLNLPICSALSPDGNMIAYGYRGHPATCWELEPPMLLGRCTIRLEASDMTIQRSTWGEAVRIAWHPLNIEIFGLDQVGLLFKWNPYEEEASMKVNTGADHFTLNQDGSLIALGSGVGVIKLLATADFSLLYHLSSQDPIFYISFSADSRRIYDIRGVYGNVWEPNILVRLADNSEYSGYKNDICSETGSLAKLSLKVEHHIPRVDGVVAIGGQSVGPLYCYGTGHGVAVLGEVGRGRICELEGLKSTMSIKQVAWSGDGQLVGLADLGGRLTIKRVTRAGDNENSWQVQQEFDVQTPNSKGPITQLIFHPVGGELLACTSTTLFSVNLTSGVLREVPLPPSIGEVKWVCHPTTVGYLLGFGCMSVRVFDWANLQELEIYKYFPLRGSAPSAMLASSPLHSNQHSFHKNAERLGKLFPDVDSSHILLQISQSPTSGQVEKQYLLFDIAELQLGLSAGQTEVVEGNIPYTLVPPDIARRIREPLGFLSHQRLAFLDTDRWICTWHLPTLPPVWPHRAQSLMDIEQYYFLPGDWVTANDAHLCTIMPDGTFLCPRNGDVATVQSTKLKK